MSSPLASLTLGSSDTSPCGFPRWGSPRPTHLGQRRDIRPCLRRHSPGSFQAFHHPSIRRHHLAAGWRESPQNTASQPMSLALRIQGTAGRCAGTFRVSSSIELWRSWLDFVVSWFRRRLGLRSFPRPSAFLAVCFCGCGFRLGGFLSPEASELLSCSVHSAAVQLFAIQSLISSITDSSGPVVLLLTLPSLHSSTLMPGNSVRMRSEMASAIRSASSCVQSLP